MRDLQEKRRPRPRLFGQEGGRTVRQRMNQLGILPLGLAAGVPAAAGRVAGDAIADVKAMVSRANPVVTVVPFAEVGRAVTGIGGFE